MAPAAHLRVRPAGGILAEHVACDTGVDERQLGSALAHDMRDSDRGELVGIECAVTQRSERQEYAVGEKPNRALRDRPGRA